MNALTRPLIPLVVALAPLVAVPPADGFTDISRSRPATSNRTAAMPTSG